MVRIMAIVRQHHKDTGVTYVLKSESYWDPETKKSRSRRKIIGKIDPETGKVIPTGSAKIPEGEKGEQTALTERVRDLEVQNEILQTKVDMLERENKKLHARTDDSPQSKDEIKKLRTIIKNARSSAQEFLKMLGGSDSEEVLHIESDGSQGQCEGGVERAGQSIEPGDGYL